MRALPAQFLEHKRDGSEFIWIVEVFPAGADTWSALRWAERAVTVDGNVFKGGILRNVDQISGSVRINQGGAVATRNDVNIELVDVDELRKTLQEIDVDGRDLQISLAMMPLNRIRNSSFESPTSGSNFDYWTETLGSGSNAIARETSIKYHGAQSAKLTCNAAPGPSVTSDAFTMRAGTTLSASIYARGGAAGDVVNVKVRVGGLYWNNSSKLFQGSATGVSFTLTTSFARYSIEGIYEAARNWATDQLSVDIILEVPTVGDVVYLDAVQVEERRTAGGYHGDRYGMTASDLFPVYWGELRRPKWDRGAIKLATKSIASRRHRDIPVATLTRDTDPTFLVHPDDLGKPFPMTYGNFENDENNFSQVATIVAMAEGLLVNRGGTAAPVTVYFDRPGEDMYQITRIYHYSDSIGRYVRELIDTSASNYSHWVTTAADAKIEADTGSDELAGGLMPLSLLLWAGNAKSNIGSWSNEANLADRDTATFASIVGAPGAGLFEGVIRGYIEKPRAFTAEQVIAAYALGKVETVLNSGSGVRSMWLRLQDVEGTFHDAPAFTTSGVFTNVPAISHQNSSEMAKAFTMSAANRNLSVWFGPQSRFDLWAKINSGGSSPNVTFKAFALGLRLDVAIPLDDAIICASMIGRKYGTTWDSRKTASNYVSGPIDIIEGILRQELGAAGSEINLAAFDQANTDYTRGQMSGQVTERTPSIDVIEQICAPGGIVYFTDGAGRESVRVLKHGAADATLSPADFVDDSIAAQYLEREELYSDFILHWGYVHGADTFIGVAYCNRNGSSSGSSAHEAKCAAAYASLGNRENTLELEARFINEPFSADYCVEFLVDWCSRRRRIISGRGFIDQLGLEFGDRVDMKLQDYLKENDTDSPRPIFTPFEFKIRKSANELTIEQSFLEVVAP